LLDQKSNQKNQGCIGTMLKTKKKSKKSVFFQKKFAFASIKQNPLDLCRMSSAIGRIYIFICS